MMNNSLILITRPSHQASHLQEKIKALGGGVVLFPTINILSYRGSPELQKNFENLGGYSWAIFLSANAVEAVYEDWQRKKISLPVIAIGASTARTLSRYHISVVGIPQEYSSRGLLQMPELQGVKNQKIAIFCGENPKPDLKEGLLARGAMVTDIYCYRREKPKSEVKNTLSESTRAGITAIVSTSRESLLNLHALFMPDEAQWLLDKTLVVISPEMENLARDLAWRAEIYVARNPTDEAIVETLSKVS